MSRTPPGTNRLLRVARSRRCKGLLHGQQSSVNYGCPKAAGSISTLGSRERAEERGKSPFETTAHFGCYIPLFPLRFAAVELILTRLGSSIKDGSPICEFLLQKMMKRWADLSAKVLKASNTRWMYFRTENRRDRLPANRSMTSLFWT